MNKGLTLQTSMTPEEIADGVLRAARQRHADTESFGKYFVMYKTDEPGGDFESNVGLGGEPEELAEIISNNAVQTGQFDKAEMVIAYLEAVAESARQAIRIHCANKSKQN